jgi:hypothetical protein
MMASLSLTPRGHLLFTVEDDAPSGPLVHTLEAAFSRGSGHGLFELIILCILVHIVVFPHPGAPTITIAKGITRYLSEVTSNKDRLFHCLNDSE